MSFLQNASLIYTTYIRKLPLKTKTEFQINVKSNRFTEQDKCPACFGESLCPKLFSDQLVLTGWTRFTASRLINAKNVFQAILKSRTGKEEQRVVLKKLGHDWELERLDHDLCTLAGQPPKVLLKQTKMRATL